MNSDNFSPFSVQQIKEFFRERSGAPRGRWGQNFLIDPNAIRAILEPWNHLETQDSIPAILEIGPGLGALTRELQKFRKALYLLEIDPILVKNLEENFPEAHIIQGDALESLKQRAWPECFVFGNLPYYITSDLLITICKHIPKIAGGTFLVQREFADRLLKEVSSISIFLSAFGTFTKIKDVKPGSFYPPPGVVSTILYFAPSSTKMTEQELKCLEWICRIAFWGKRKKITSSLRDAPEPFPLAQDTHNSREIAMEVFQSLGFSSNARPEEIPIHRFREIAEELALRIF